MNRINNSISDDMEKRIEAMYHLEVCFEPKDEHGNRKPIEWIDAHIAAAHYLIQSMFNGNRPDNYDEVIAEAKRFDNIDKENCDRYLQKKSAA